MEEKKLVARFRTYNVTDNIIQCFFERNKNKGISEEIIKKDLDERLEPYAKVLDTIRNSFAFHKNINKEIPDCIDYINDIIISYVNGYIDSRHETNKEQTFIIQIPSEIFRFDKVFFDDCKITVAVSFCDIFKMLAYKERRLIIEYKDENASLKKYRDKNNNLSLKLVGGEFTFDLGDEGIPCGTTLSKFIYHAFTYAYQDYKLLLDYRDRRKGKNFDLIKGLFENKSILVTDVLKNPHEYIEKYGKYGSLVVDCCDALNAMDYIVENKYVEKAINEMNDYLRMKGYEITYKELIEHTTIYCLLYNLSVFLQQLKVIDDEGVTAIGLIIKSLKNVQAVGQYDCNREYNKFVLKIERFLNNNFFHLTRPLCCLYTIYGKRKIRIHRCLKY